MITLRKRIAFTAIAATLPLSLLFACFELSLRLKQASAKATEARRMIDSEFGWLPTPNLIREGEAIDAVRQKSHFLMTQDSHGFRKWGDTSTAHKRVFVLGDSYTQSDDIDDGKTFYAVLQNRMPEAEFWAFGCSGFGTFQQWMILEKYVGEIRPDVLILQMSSNDVINNLLELEDNMPFLATPGPRPYLMDDGTTRFHMATRHKGLAQYSRAIASLSDRFESLTHRSEQWVPGQMRNYGVHRKPRNFQELLDRSVLKTAEILERMQKTVGPETRILAFYDEDVPPLSDALRQACQKANIPLIDTIGPAMMVEEGRANSYVYRTRDLWHWNDDGHALVADLLEEPLRNALNQGVSESRSTAHSKNVIARSKNANQSTK